MKKKTEAAGRDGERDPKREGVFHVHGKQHPADAARKRHAACKAVDAVHEVVGVGQADDPQKGDDEAHHAKRQFSEQWNGDGFEIPQPKHRRQRNKALHAKTQTGRKRVQVVAPAQPRNHQPADDVDQSTGEARFVHSPQTSRRHKQHDYQPSAARRGRGM